jgi:hypothetical protein
MAAVVEKSIHGTDTDGYAWPEIYNPPYLYGVIVSVFDKSSSRHASQGKIGPTLHDYQSITPHRMPSHAQRLIRSSGYRRPLTTTLLYSVLQSLQIESPGRTSVEDPSMRDAESPIFLDFGR